MKKILKIEVNEELDMTEVLLKVPKFQNFGKRLGELERKAAETSAASEADPGNMEMEMEMSTNALAKIGGMMDTVAAKVKAMPDGPQKTMMQEMLKQATSSIEEEEEEDEDEEIVVKNDAKEFEYDLQELWVELPAGMKWNKSAESKVDEFLVEWPKIRPAVLDATAKYYKKHYADMKEYLGDGPEAEFLLPKPGAPEVVADLFRISSIHLREDGAIGLSGHCTWDDEHAYGVRLKKGKVVCVGQASDAFG